MGKPIYERDATEKAALAQEAENIVLAAMRVRKEKLTSADELVDRVVRRMESMSRSFSEDRVGELIQKLDHLTQQRQRDNYGKYVQEAARRFLAPSPDAADTTPTTRNPDTGPGAATSDSAAPNSPVTGGKADVQAATQTNTPERTANAQPKPRSASPRAAANRPPPPVIPQPQAPVAELRRGVARQSPDIATQTPVEPFSTPRNGDTRPGAARLDIATASDEMLCVLAWQARRLLGSGQYTPEQRENAIMARVTEIARGAPQDAIRQMVQTYNALDSHQKGLVAFYPAKIRERERQISDGTYRPVTVSRPGNGNTRRPRDVTREELAAGERREQNFERGRAEERAREFARAERIRTRQRAGEEAKRLALAAARLAVEERLRLEAEAATAVHAAEEERKRLEAEAKAAAAAAKQGSKGRKKAKARTGTSGGEPAAVPPPPPVAREELPEDWKILARAYLEARLAEHLPEKAEALAALMPANAPTIGPAITALNEALYLQGSHFSKVFEAAHRVLPSDMLPNSWYERARPFTDLMGLLDDYAQVAAAEWKKRDALIAAIKAPGMMQGPQDESFDGLPLRNLALLLANRSDVSLNTIHSCMPEGKYLPKASYDRLYKGVRMDAAFIADFIGAITKARAEGKIKTKPPSPPVPRREPSVRKPAVARNATEVQQAAKPEPPVYAGGMLRDYVVATVKAYLPGREAEVDGVVASSPALGSTLAALRRHTRRGAGISGSDSSAVLAYLELSGGNEMQFVREGKIDAEVAAAFDGFAQTLAKRWPKKERTAEAEKSEEQTGWREKTARTDKQNEGPGC